MHTRNESSHWEISVVQFLTPFFCSSYWGADCCLSYKKMFIVGVKLVEFDEYALLCFSINFLGAIIAGISFPLLFTCSWPDSWAFLCLFTIQVGLLIGHILKFGLFFDSCRAASILSVRSFIKDLTSSIFFSARIVLIMLLNLSASKETWLLGKFERKLISLSSSTMIVVSSAT